MAKVDLHVHSKYSDYPSTWAHRMYKSPESFTEPETIYQQAKSRGMTLVTITDHDDIRGAIELVAAHPEDCFISCEITTYFPEDHCKIHILVYGISEAQYDQIMQIRGSIYDLREYIIEQNIAYSVAHATYDQDGKLSFEHIEKLVLLFDVFEVINGGGDAQNNLLLHRYLENLDDQTLDELQAKHKIQPISTDPWNKSYTGGADDHCGILIGSAYTQSAASGVNDFLNSIRRKQTTANGMHGTFESYATGVIKHIHDYRNDRDANYSQTKMSDFLALFFEGDRGNLLKRFKKSRSLKFLKRKNSTTHKALHRLLQDIDDLSEQDIAVKIPVIYDDINHLHDEMFRTIIEAFSTTLPQGDIFSTFQKVATIMPMTLLALPFLGSMRHQVLKQDIKQNLIEGTAQPYTQKALWFTDTIDDLNGVSVTLRQIAAHSLEHGYQLKLVTCVDEQTINTELPLNAVNFHPVEQIVVPGYEQQNIGFPSLLSVMKTVVAEQPDQIIISTPGPLGLAAMICAKLMDLPIKTIYHTDFAEQLLRMTGEEQLAKLSDSLVNTFYKQSQTVFVPSQAYRTKLLQAGLEQEKLKLFPRGLDTSVYRPTERLDISLNGADRSTQPACQTALAKRINNLPGTFTMLFAGRVSQDKNLTTLAELMLLAEREHPGVFNLVIAGDGPDLPRLKKLFSGHESVFLTGRLKSRELVTCYQHSDLLVFPSHTDTFGMVVLEGLACGLPALVTPNGGPKEIIEQEVTGRVVNSDDATDWLANVNYYRTIKDSDPAEFLQLRMRCADQVLEQNNWQAVFDEVLGNECKLPEPMVQRLSAERKRVQDSAEQISSDQAA